MFKFPTSKGEQCLSELVSAILEDPSSAQPAPVWKQREEVPDLLSAYDWVNFADITYSWSISVCSSGTYVLMRPVR